MTERLVAVDLMYEVFQTCRLGGMTSDLPLADLEAVLACILVRGTVALAPDEPDLAAALVRHGGPLNEAELGLSRDHPLVVELSSTNQAIFDVIVHAVADLRRLVARGEGLAVRNLGYALHNLPRLLVYPSDFSRGDFMSFPMRFIAHGWALLSVELRTALAALVERTPERLDKVAREEGFAASMFRADR